MSEKESKNRDEHADQAPKSQTPEKAPRVRKKVQLVEEPVESKPQQPEPEEAGAQAGEAAGAYKTEHEAGSKVRVARSTEVPDLAQRPKSSKPGRRAVS